MEVSRLTISQETRSRLNKGLNLNRNDKWRIRFNALKEFIEENPNRKFSVAELLNACGYIVRNQNDYNNYANFIYKLRKCGALVELDGTGLKSRYKIDLQKLPLDKKRILGIGVSKKKKERPASFNGYSKDEMSVISKLKSALQEIGNEPILTRDLLERLGYDTNYRSKSYESGNNFIAKLVKRGNLKKQPVSQGVNSYQWVEDPKQDIVEVEVKSVVDNQKDSDKNVEVTDTAESVDKKCEKTCEETVEKEIDNRVLSFDISINEIKDHGPKRLTSFAMGSTDKNTMKSLINKLIDNI